MKRLVFLTLILLSSLGLYAQSIKVIATIDNKCNTVPATISIPSGKAASSFIMGILTAGNNCYDGAKFLDRGFTIKNASGDVVYRYNVNRKDEVFTSNGSLKDLRLEAGIYYVHVEGGYGAKLELSYQLK